MYSLTGVKRILQWKLGYLKPPKPEKMERKKTFTILETFKI